MRCVVVRAGAIGDVALSFPVLHALKMWRRDIHLTFVARTAARALAREANLADEVLDLSEPRFAPLFSPSGGAGAELERLFGESDLTVSLLSDPDGSFAARVRALGARKVLSFGSIREGEPAARQLFEVLRPLGVAGFSERVPALAAGRFVPCGAPLARAVFHAGSGSPRKNWPPSRFAACARAAASEGYEVVLPRGESDAQAVAAVAAGLEGRCRVVELDLASLASVIARARFFVGNDSGITHIAGQLGVHTVAVFGPTDPAVWRPVGPRVHVVRGEGGAFPSLRRVHASGGLGQFLDHR